ncbi:Dehydrogenase/reductase SDR family member 7 [Seminavis robusta]|uniref:Dehydrogenase/reductase SDR family member 7 n=1 Tax=Seminavis robusta TaxID=568900 RepID=A0A9N8DUM0_9STRA|nr:Dehydrogenase/reductase SDR family member 7 [Seminavis robusta]|eukprot:Sro370_g128310.1 Dehydrogenase/reductase SDR family member 7 (355) ;mRNA; r:2017-3301
MMMMFSIAWILVVLVVAWNNLDAAPTLYFYDAAATWTGGWQHSSLQNKTIWITGASSGIGASMVCQALQAGAAHVILSSRKRDKLLNVASKCQSLLGSKYHPEHTKMSIVPYDAANNSTTTMEATIVDRVWKACGDDPLDMVILNAGVYQNQPAMLTTKQERDYVTRVNYQAPVDLTQALLEKWKTHDNPKGHIVVVASIMAHGPYGLSSTYAASKAALRTYFWSLATEESQWLTVNMACPAATLTGFWNPVASTLHAGGSAMTADRVAHLILTGISGPYMLFYETWITKMPGILWLGLAHYTPGLFLAFSHFLAYIRVPIWYHERIDAMDVSLLMTRFVQIVMGQYPPVVVET